MTSKVESAGLALSGILRKLYEGKYYSHKIPSGGDDELSELIDSLSELHRQELYEVAESLDKDIARVLGVYAERMSAMVVRDNSVRAFRRGLLALIIYAASQDSRDVVLLLSLIVDSAKRINKDPKSLINEVCLSLGLGTFQFIDKFLERKSKDQGIDAMGYEAAYDEAGFYYRRTW
jgi:hypothetical protein